MAAVNLLVYILLLEEKWKSLLTSRITGNPLITGGALGPENSVQATVFFLLMGIWFLSLAKKRGRWP